MSRTVKDNLIIGSALVAGSVIGVFLGNFIADLTLPL